MESLIVAANIIKAALSNFFHINIELDGSLNQQPISDIFQLILLLCRTKRRSCIYNTERDTIAPELSDTTEFIWYVAHDIF